MASGLSLELFPLWQGPRITKILSIKLIYTQHFQDKLTLRLSNESEPGNSGTVLSRKESRGGQCPQSLCSGFYVDVIFHLLLCRV